MRKTLRATRHANRAELASHFGPTNRRQETFSQHSRNDDTAGTSSERTFQPDHASLLQFPLELLQGADASIIRLKSGIEFVATPNRKTFLWNGIGPALTIAVLLLLAARTAALWMSRFTMPQTWDYGPAQLAVYVNAVVEGAPLYRDFRVAPFMPLVYGPVVPMLTARLAPIAGAGPIAALEAGRLITIASTLLVSAMLFILSRRAGSSAYASMIAALGFLLTPIVMRWGFEYRVDMPALLCEVGGIAAFAGGATAGALALFVTAFFIKQGSAVGIATVVLFCWTLGERRRAIAFAMIWLVAIVPGTLSLALAYPYYVLNTVVAVRTTHVDWAAPVFFLAIMIGGSLGLGIFATIALTRRRMTDRLTQCFLVVAVIHNLVSCARWGSNAYYFLSSLAAMTIVAAAGIDLALERIRTMRLAPQLVSGMALTLLLSAGFFLTPQRFTNGPWDQRALALLRDIDRPVLTDAAELKLIDPRPNLQWIDLMVLASMEQLGTFDDTALLDSIQHHRIAAFALDAEGLDRRFRGRALMWPRLRQSIEANYRAVPSDGPPYLMIPKETQ